MISRLFVRPHPPAKLQYQQVEWALYTFGGERVAGGVSAVSQIHQLLAQYDIQDLWLYFIVPASDFSYLTAEVPAKQVRFIGQTLPFVIEEAIAEDIEAMHLVIGEKLSPQKFPVLVSRKQTMDQWYQAARQFELPLHGLFVDAEFVNSDSADIGVLIDGEDALVFSAGLSCVRTQLNNLLTYFELLDKQISAPLTMQVLVPNEHHDQHTVLLSQLEHLDNIQPRLETFSLSPFELLCSLYLATENPTNLCSSEYPSSAQTKSTGLRKWLPLAAVVLLGFFIQLGFDWTETWLNQRQAEQYRQQSTAIYQRLFPAERIVASPRRQLEGKLRNTAGNPRERSFLAMLGEAGYQLSQHPQKAGMLMNNMQYNENRNELAMEISAPSLEDLDAYKQSIAQSGYEVSIGSAIKEKNSVRGKLTVRVAGG